MLINSIQGRTVALNDFLDKTLSIRLYTDSGLTLDANGDFNLVDFTEAAVAGYVAQTMILTDWTITDNGAGLTEAEGAEQTFSPTEAVTVYGYFITYTPDVTPIVLWAEEFSSPIVRGVGGGDIRLTPHYDASTRVA